MKPSTIAIVGMAGRFPGARSVTEFWRNLRDGVESIRTRSDVELLAAGVTPEELASPDYVKRASVLDDLPLFDPSFFGLSPRDASIMDPQHRHFLECAWEALEDAGHPPKRFEGSIGVFAGSGLNSYLIHNLLANRRLLESAGLFQLKQTGNDQDVLATRVSYQFDLRGPSINVQTACSTWFILPAKACSITSATWRWQAELRSRSPMAAVISTAKEKFSLATAIAAPSTRHRAEQFLEVAWGLSCCGVWKTRSKSVTIFEPSF